MPLLIWQMAKELVTATQRAKTKNRASAKPRDEQDKTGNPADMPKRRSARTAGQDAPNYSEAVLDSLEQKETGKTARRLDRHGRLNDDTRKDHLQRAASAA